MQGNDIGADQVRGHVAVMFEGLLMSADDTPVAQPKRKWLRKQDEELDDDEFIKRVVRRWKVNEFPMKSAIHIADQFKLGVDVYTFLDAEFVPHIENWLFRKGLSAIVFAYFDLDELREDFKYNRDVKTLYTASQEDAWTLGLRASVAQPDRTFGI